MKGACGAGYPESHANSPLNPKPIIEEAISYYCYYTLSPKALKDLSTRSAAQNCRHVLSLGLGFRMGFRS